MTAQEQQMVDMLLKTNASQVELLSKQSKQIESLEQRIKELTAQIAWFQRQMFGRKSEKLAAVDPNQLSLFDEPEIPVAVQQAQEVTIRTIAYCRVCKKAVPLQPIYKPYKYSEYDKGRIFSIVTGPEDQWQHS